MRTASPPLETIPVRYLSIRQFAKYTGLSERTILDRLHDRTLPAKLVGRRWLIDIDRFDNGQPAEVRP